MDGIAEDHDSLVIKSHTSNRILRIVAIHLRKFVI